MAQALIPHSIVFVAVTAILVLVLTRSRLPFAWRLTITLAAGALYIVHYLGLEALTGWPSENELPAEFDVLGMRVVEPDRDDDGSGHIELWIRPPGAVDSRLYRLPYSGALHEEIERAEARQGDGHAQRGRATASGEGSGAGRVSIENRPPPRLPSKGSR